MPSGVLVSAGERVEEGIKREGVEMEGGGRRRRKILRIWLIVRIRGGFGKGACVGGTGVVSSGNEGVWLCGQHWEVQV